MVNTACAVIFSWGLITFSRRQPRPWLAMTVAVPYLVIVVGMGYTRQAAAIGMGMLALVALSDRQLVRYTFYVALAASFHKTAVILMPLAALSGVKNKPHAVAWIGLFSLLLYVAFLNEALSGLEHGYLDAQYQSGGAAVRVLMNAVPAVIFLLFRKRFVMPREEKDFWIWMSLIALGFLALLLVDGCCLLWACAVCLDVFRDTCQCLAAVPVFPMVLAGALNSLVVIMVRAYAGMQSFFEA